MRKIFAYVAALLLFAVAPSPLCAQAIQQIDVVDFGIYRGERVKQEDAPDTPAGVLGYIAGLELIEATTTIPPRRGVRFGFQFRIRGRTGARVRLKLVVLIPRPGIKNGESESRFVRAEYFQDATVGGLNYVGYKFDYAWEIVLGNWSFEIWDGDRKLASQTFSVMASA